MNLFPVEWIDRLIAINTETERSNKAAIDFLRPLAQKMGLKIKLQTVREKGKTFINLIAYNHGLDHPDLLLFNTHLDTVSGGDRSQWTKTGGDPWKATWAGKKVYGLGTADVKIDFLCKLWAAGNSRLERPFALVGTYGEERGLIGVQKLLSGLKITPRYAVVGEPSDLELIYAHKGHLIATARLPLERQKPALVRSWRGKAAHSSTPHLGQNALTRAWKEIQKKGWGLALLNAGTNSNRVPEFATAHLTRERTERTEVWFRFIEAVERLAAQVAKKRDRSFSPSFTTLSWNLCESKQGYAEVTLDFRPLPGVDPLDLRRRLEKALPRQVEWSSLSVDLPLRGRKDSPLLRAASLALKQCGVLPRLRTKASSTEAAVYHQKGAEAFVFGPGISVGNVHKPNEYNRLDQIRIATQFYRQLLHQAQGGF